MTIPLDIAEMFLGQWYSAQLLLSLSTEKIFDILSNRYQDNPLIIGQQVMPYFRKIFNKKMGHGPIESI